MLSPSAHTGHKPVFYSPLCPYIACSLSCDLTSVSFSSSFFIVPVYLSSSVFTDFSLDISLCCLVVSSLFDLTRLCLHWFFFSFFFFSFSVISYFSLWVIAPLPCLLIFFCPIFSLFFSPPLVHLPLLPPPCTSIPSFHFSVSTPVGAGCVRRPSSVSLTCRSTPSRTQRPNLTSVLTAPSHSPTPATWPSTSASTVGPSLTPAPTARNLSGSSVTYSSTHGTTDPPNPITHPYHIPCSLNLSC